MVIAAASLALAIGAVRATTNGRFRGSREVRTAVGDTAENRARAGAPGPWAKVLEAVPGAQLGGRATLLQFSSAFCAPCRATRRVLADVAATVPDVVHVEVDAEQHLDLVRALGVVRTPTTVVFDASGSEVARASGAPRREQVLRAVAEAV
jgi:thiol-disulfide isomerase/thioredoxin